MSIAVAAPSLAELELATLRLAIHEAGHALAAVLLGHRVDGLTIELDQGESGCCLVVEPNRQQSRRWKPRAAFSSVTGRSVSGSNSG